MSDDDEVVGWSVMGHRSELVFICASCLRHKAEFDADLFGAADWAKSEGLAPDHAAAGEVLPEHAEAQQPCTQCGKPLSGG